ncbi:CRTAC1 family protein [Crocinitomicaceae bacterium]|nr:CRTAC1 family protein [Crocinitomicaceae bacterium]MDC0257148.1 CRTAC1 family protein [Crocinitomicaceae bacterium]
MKTCLAFLLFLGCSMVVEAQLFEEVSDRVGVDYIYPGNEFQMAGGGLMVIDVNKDGWEDFFQCGGVFDSKLWINDKGTFHDGTEEFGLDVLSGYFIQGALGADFDNDGYQDFFVANFGKGMNHGDKHSPVLMHNVDGSHFEMIALDSILPAGDYSSASWGDFNKDGYSDLYITNYVGAMGELMDSSGRVIGYDPVCLENKLLLNLAGKGFKECAKELGLNNAGCGLSASFTDVDSDGDLDLLLLNDFGQWTGEGNRYYRNDYPEFSFTDQSESYGFDEKMYGMGIGAGDYNFDGVLEYFVTNIGPNAFYQRRFFSFDNEAEKMGIDAPFVRPNESATSWSGLLFDMDFDGDLDLYVSRGNVAVLIPKTAVSDPNLLYENIDGEFMDISEVSGVNDRLSHRGAVIFDYDHDGKLDIISSVVKMPWAAFEGEEQKIRVYHNKQKTGNWIGIELIGEGTINRDCFGCYAYFTLNDTTTLKMVDGASGHASQSSRILYFGLGDQKRLDELNLIWPDLSRNNFKRLKGGRVYQITSSGEVRKKGK